MCVWVCVWVWEGGCVRACTCVGVLALCNHSDAKGHHWKKRDSFSPPVKLRISSPVLNSPTAEITCYFISALLVVVLLTRTFVTPRVNTKTSGQRPFSYAGPSVWNNLPQALCHSDSAFSFKAALKTLLFNDY